MKSIVALAVIVLPALVAADTRVNPNNLPHKSEKGQTGYNDCSKYPDSKSSQCQTLYLNNGGDYCLYGPPYKAEIGDIEDKAVSYCTQRGHGARLIPKGTIKTSHYVVTPHYVQITGIGNFTKINVPNHDEGGELDPHGATGVGNPVGSVVIGKDPRPGKNFGKLIQFYEWTNFMAYNEFCIRACFDGPDAAKWCNHIYDIEGCYWNMPGNYEGKGFDECKADDVSDPMGVYGKSTYYRGQGTEPAPHRAAKTSSCQTYSALGTSYPTTKSSNATKAAPTLPAGHKVKRHFGGSVLHL